MRNSKDRPSKAVGYIRLSTEKQAQDDGEFEKQAARIRQACAKHGFDLLLIFEDTASGADPLGAVRRDGLNDAVARARAEGAALIIPEPTRLFRHAEAARNFLKTLDVPVFSVKHGRFLGARALLSAIEHGETVARNIREGTSKAMSVKSKQGVEFSTSEVRKKAAEASAKVRSAKSDTIAHQVSDILRSDPAYRDLSHKALADLLNRRRLLTGWKRPWTQHSVRDVRRKAEEKIAFEAEIDDLDDLPVVAGVVEAPPGQLVAGLPGESASPVIKDEATLPTPAVLTEEESTQAELEQIPGFGIF